MSILTQGGAAGGGSTTDLAGIANSAAASGQVYYGGPSGTPVSEAAFAYNATTDTMSVPNITATTGMTTVTLTATGLIKGKDGTAAAPSISGTTTTNSGFYFSGASPALTINGVLQGYWDAGHQYMYKGGTVTAYGATDGAVNCSVGPGPIANSICFGPATTGSGAATTHVMGQKAVTGIADNTATAVLTFTVPNVAQRAAFEVILVGGLGAGGAIGADEAVASIAYIVTIVRTAGVNAVATVSTAYGSAAAAVAGAATATITGAMSAVSGAVGATNTFTFNATITKSGGSSANHNCMTHVRLLNANAGGVTVA